MKFAVFHPKAREALREFPEEIRREFGKAVFDLQKGERLQMPLSKSISSVATGVEELRLKDRSGAYRVFYYTRLENSILIFHAFVKKTQKTSRREIQKGMKYLKEMII